MFRKIIHSLVGSSQEERRAELHRNLIRHEAQIGGALFGPIPKGGRRDFFCLDERTWVWHEEWIDATGQHRNRTTRYTVRPNSILKTQDGGHYQEIGAEEAAHLRLAVQLYQERTKAEMYSFV
jgi:hypothetical protein